METLSAWTWWDFQGREWVYLCGLFLLHLTLVQIVFTLQGGVRAEPAAFCRLPGLWMIPELPTLHCMASYLKCNVVNGVGIFLGMEAIYTYIQKRTEACWRKRGLEFTNSCSHLESIVLTQRGGLNKHLTWNRQVTLSSGIKINPHIFHSQDVVLTPVLCELMFDCSSAAHALFLGPQLPFASSAQGTVGYHTWWERGLRKQQQWLL